MSTSIDLSIVVPVINEEQTLPELLTTIAEQQCSLTIEIIIADGGSQDRTKQVCETFSLPSHLSLKFINCPRGRGKQMNKGAEVSISDTLFFLHSDSLFHNHDAIQAAHDAYTDSLKALKQERLAGHFPLRFSDVPDKNRAAYFYYEAKTTTNRRDTINGDQGLWIKKSFFNNIGGYDESLPYMEDARIARVIDQQGEWLTLPHELYTSSRRFQEEGLAKRQVLNALICNFDHIGLDAFFEHAAKAYRQQSDSNHLDLLPFFQLIHRLSLKEGFKHFFVLWYKTGEYVSDNIWQLFFTRDCRRDFKKGVHPHRVERRVLRRYDRCTYIFDNVIFKTLTAVTTAMWFYSTYLYLKLSSPHVKPVDSQQKQKVD